MRIYFWLVFICILSSRHKLLKTGIQEKIIESINGVARITEEIEEKYIYTFRDGAVLLI